ncbi:nuclear transport factor 2 family protein [Streptodolium elevatio]
MKFDRREVEAEFARWWSIGNAGEDWASWAQLYTPDAYYIDHFWGPLHGRDEIDLWIHAVMKGVPEIYGVLDWYTIENGIVTFHYLNRRDNPSDEGPPYWDFAGLSVLWYAGDGLWSKEEDFWDRTGARDTSVEYAAACERAGLTEPLQRMTRKHWPDAPSWARHEAPPSPSWLTRDNVPGITKPRELRDLLTRLRG